MVRGFTFYGKSTGLEIKEVERVYGKVKEGKVRLRFFTMGGERKNIMFLLDPDEAFILGENIKKVVNEGKSFSLYHTFRTQTGEEVSTRLFAERWERNGRTGYAFVISRGNDRINVSMDEGRFLYAAELLKALSISSSWWEMLEMDDEEDEAKEMKEIEKIEEVEKVEDKDEEEDGGTFETQKMEGEIQAVARSGQAFKLNDNWINLKEATIIHGRIERGKRVKVLISKSEGRYYAEKVEVER